MLKALAVFPFLIILGTMILISHEACKDGSQQAMRILAGIILLQVWSTWGLIYLAI